MKKTVIKLKVKCNRKMAHERCKPWSFSSQKSTLTTEPAGHLLKRLKIPLINHICL